MMEHPMDRAVRLLLFLGWAAIWVLNWHPFVVLKEADLVFVASVLIMDKSLSFSDLVELLC